MKEFNASGLNLTGGKVWVVHFGGRKYGPYVSEDEAVECAKQLLERDDAHLSDRFFEATIYCYWVKAQRQYSIVMEKAPTFRTIANPDEVQKWANGDRGWFESHAPLE